jgi:adenine nucleotide transporter 17
VETKKTQVVRPSILSVGKTVQTLISPSSQSLPTAVAKILKDEGLAGLYSGLSSSLVGIAVTNAVFYYGCESVPA